ncbi:hypothetical protein H9L21_10105 [Aeromicrobium senzhongii]|uniref:Uncharacterized protein n=1 Tax=Aeromicrobium senzhongii TaxID=2663859 RepID=A0ABX6SQ10_9ACTN|nr:hypothetical protein [Aeromicrobium senzhongii]MTB89268.1 hypothetical protein [Aeromicrobium senzhongii]QNL93469.1 hypothetical protein H9L21_10105 [Aeromicrobium senzhongii]
MRPLTFPRHEGHLIAALVVCVSLSGCGESGSELEKRAEGRADETRTLVDDLAARVGTNPEVKQDATLDCVPGQDDSGLNPTYTVHVATDDTSAARLTSEVADELDAEGWTVKRDSVDPSAEEVEVRFAKGEFNVGVLINQEAGRASVGGSGGCVR